MKEKLGAKVVEEVAKQVLEDVNNAPAQDNDEDIDEAMLETIAQKMIKDLEKASEGCEQNDASGKDSNKVIDAIIKKVKSDLEEEEKPERSTLVDAIANKVKKDLEEKQVEVANNLEKSDDADSPAKENTAANSTDAKEKEELVEGLGN